MTQLIDHGTAAITSPIARSRLRSRRRAGGTGMNKKTVAPWARSAALGLAIAALCIGVASGARAADRAADRAAIAEMAYCYAYAVDILGNHPLADPARDADLPVAARAFGDCLTDDAQLRLFLGGREGEPVAAGAGGPTEFAKFVRGYFTAYGYVGTQHVVGNVSVTFTGPDEAAVISYIPAYHWLADGRILLVPVRYEDRAVRSGDRWKIANRDIIAMRFWVADGYTPNPGDPALSRPAPCAAPCQ